MKRLRLSLLSAILGLAMGVGAAGCQKADGTSTDKKLDEVIARLDKIEKQLASGPGAARPTAQRPPPGPQPGRPDPSKVYAVPIEGAAYKGAEHAKVTVVEAFEFA